ncbi:hypothetical protein [Mesorhizobium sp. M7A.F.Ce.TU.012.03.2.1]|uniref:hypothetical protein n=1 Tax=Mesorhizobium sp. M7A.F.Ce.TU.012.03.2.1 TaxID=2493681 RepID=UPI000FD97C4C|nr:hypothetical protein [Mesorhizobium sp. M7A.F.Ce.TU.012.03.2.1]AZV18958.1 hypothetical protein EJ079_07510 [Mesorhizobium sp. M7A.F.Ce.TU.012.03.2.1]
MAKRVRFDHDPNRDAQEDAQRDYRAASEAMFESRTKSIGLLDDKLIQINDEIVAAHGISAKAQHKRLLFLLLMVMDKKSVVDLSGAGWSVPKDAPPWKETRQAHVEPIALALKKLIDQFDRAMDNVTFVAAVGEADPNGWFADRYAALYDLLDVMGVAASLKKALPEGAESFGGNRPNPAWVQDFGRMGQRFWATYMKRGTRQPGTLPSFTREASVAGENAFTRWIIDVYTALTRPGERNLAMLRTELSKLGAYGG